LRTYIEHQAATLGQLPDQNFTWHSQAAPISPMAPQAQQPVMMG
jgi:hypothetical protein